MLLFYACSVIFRMSVFKSCSDRDWRREVGGSTS